MVYKHGSYTLYKLDINWGRKKIKKTIYFFAKKTPKKGIPCDIPNGYNMGINKKTEMPYLKFSTGKISLWQKVKKSRS